MCATLLGNLIDALVYNEIRGATGYSIVQLYQESVRHNDPVSWLVHILTCEDGPIVSVIDHKNLYRRLTAVRNTGHEEDPTGGAGAY